MKLFQTLHLNDDLKKKKKKMIGLISGKWVLILTVQNPHMKLSSVEKKNIHYPPILFNNLPVKRVQFHRHLGLTLDSQLNFNEHISSTLSIVNKLTAVLRKLQIVLPRHSLLTIFKAFIRPHLDYCDATWQNIERVLA